VILLHPGIDDRTQLGHLQQSSFGDVGGRYIFLDGRQLGLGRVVVVLEAIDASKYLRQVDGVDANAVRFKNAFAVTNRIKGRRAGADGADAEVLEAANDATD
jgi:hypothetical protein